ncbi:hypothetical protein CC1G_10410 [Coprinopsis cinerea okayama7|uniref:Uncharacterized protein n=1 Tax=Coprinopsis cinerea (strain Okayama-7 / 130 / ATCC MYA-4618 / FGSC 9003) TaxID=240176 RepID=A8PAP5_COPC7|nr:hypothetical protein CC1G_10410 [Coprinopsis cinerea okayama7\|eukprot:XP_001840026.2 hypothetical protein CC1G_10410 [Coprinopsis cinerea okayama7\
MTDQHSGGTESTLTPSSPYTDIFYFAINATEAVTDNFWLICPGGSRIRLGEGDPRLEPTHLYLSCEPTDERLRESVDNNADCAIILPRSPSTFPPVEVPERGQPEFCYVDLRTVDNKFGSYLKDLTDLRWCEQNILGANFKVPNMSRDGVFTVMIDVLGRVKTVSIDLLHSEPHRWAYMGALLARHIWTYILELQREAELEIVAAGDPNAVSAIARALYNMDDRSVRLLGLVWFEEHSAWVPILGYTPEPHDSLIKSLSIS